MKKIICKICGREIETETGRMRSHLKPTIPNVWCNGRKRRPTQRALDAKPDNRLADALLKDQIEFRKALRQ